ncbi:MAG: histidine kinase, partial [Lachnospiraceae bacterium]|nr:histidine kinase [Lachnospiraceae bacterium]
MKKKKPLDTSKRLYLSIMLPALISILLMSLLTYIYSIRARQNTMDDRIRDFSCMVASMPAVAQMIESGQEDPEVLSLLRHMEENDSQIDVLVVCDKDSRRYYHTDESKVGEIFVGGDEKAILQGQDPYISSATGTLGPQRRAFYPVRNSSGEIIGFVMASVLNRTIDSLRRQILLSC